MDGYMIKAGEKYNGGYTVVIGGFTLRILGGYEPAWENIYNTQNGFVDWRGNTHKHLMGKQFSIKITTGGLIKEDYDALVEELKKEVFNVSCPDFEGECYCERIPAALTQANYLGTRYKISFTLIAKELIKPDSGGGL